MKSRNRIGICCAHGRKSCNSETNCVSICTQSCVAAVCITKPRPAIKATGQNIIMAGWSGSIEGSSGSLGVNLDLLLRQIKGLNQILSEYGQQIEALAAAPRYQSAVQSLTCYKGIKNIFALTMITEIGDIRLFSLPRKLVSWIGRDIRVYSSGGKHHRFGITKQGNRYIRTAFVEANQRGYRTAKIGQDLKSRRKHIAPELVNIADRCLRRLNKKGNRLLLAGKHPNKVKVACAREMVGFVWESLHKVAA